MAFALAKFHTCFCIQWFYSQIFIKKNIPLILTTTRKLIKLYSNAFSFKIHLINKATVPSICKNIQERFIKSHIEQNQIIQIIKWQHWRFYFYKTKSFWNSFNFISGRPLVMFLVNGFYPRFVPKAYKFFQLISRLRKSQGINNWVTSTIEYQKKGY